MLKDDEGGDRGKTPDNQRREFVPSKPENVVSHTHTALQKKKHDCLPSHFKGRLCPKQ